MAREGLLIQADKDGNRPEQPAPMQNTPKKKWENFWYYHKWHVVVLLFVLFLAFIMIRDAMSPKADYQIGMITAYSAPQEAINQMQKEIVKYGEDLNGDGRVMVQINNYVITPKDSGSEVEIANQVKLDADLAAGQSMLFLTDEDSFLEQQGQQHMFAKSDGSKPGPGEENSEEVRVPLADVKALSGLTYREDDGDDLMKGLGLSLRLYQGTSVEGKEDDYRDASLRLFRKLKEG